VEVETVVVAHPEGLEATEAEPGEGVLVELEETDRHN